MPKFYKNLYWNRDPERVHSQYRYLSNTYEVQPMWGSPRVYEKYRPTDDLNSGPSIRSPIATAAKMWYESGMHRSMPVYEYLNKLFGGENEKSPVP